MDIKIDNRKDILLLLLYSPGMNEGFNEPILGRTKLVKALFLFKEEAVHHFKKNTSIDYQNFYEFFAWDFGPFCQDIYDDINFFVLREFIKITETDQLPLPESASEWEEWIDSTGVYLNDEEYNEFHEMEFTLTPKGVNFAKDLYETLNSNQTKLLKEFKSKINSASLRSILRYVYKNYPQFTDKSIIKNKILEY